MQMMPFVTGLHFICILFMTDKLDSVSRCLHNCMTPLCCAL